jgi:hypothetical protein
MHRRVIFLSAMVSFAQEPSATVPPPAPVAPALAPATAPVVPLVMAPTAAPGSVADSAGEFVSVALHFAGPAKAEFSDASVQIGTTRRDAEGSVSIGSSPGVTFEWGKRFGPTAALAAGFTYETDRELSTGELKIDGAATSKLSFNSKVRTMTLNLTAMLFSGRGYFGGGILIPSFTIVSSSYITASSYVSYQALAGFRVKEQLAFEMTYRKYWITATEYGTGGMIDYGSIGYAPLSFGVRYFF